jgi:hypothetical protein
MKNRSKDKFFEPPIAGFRRRSAWGKIPGVPIRRLHLSYRFDLSQRLGLSAGADSLLKREAPDQFHRQERKPSKYA